MALGLGFKVNGFVLRFKVLSPGLGLGLGSGSWLRFLARV